MRESMTELSPEQKRLLAQLRGVDDPTPDERASGDAAVRRMLRVQGMRNPPPLSAAASSWPLAAEPVAVRSGTARLAWGLGVTAVATLGLFAAVTWRPPAQPALSPIGQSAATAPPAPVSAPLPEAEAPAPTVEPALHPPAARQATTKQPHSSLAEELRFLSSVDAEIRAGTYDRALRRLTENHSTSQLHEERAALRVLALCGRKHDSQAAHARAQFLQSSPSSVLAARVRAACAGEPSP